MNFIKKFVILLVLVFAIVVAIASNVQVAMADPAPQPVFEVYEEYQSDELVSQLLVNSQTHEAFTYTLNRATGEETMIQMLNEDGTPLIWRFPRPIN